MTLVLTTIACRQNKKATSIVEGDLFFRPLRYGSFYNQPDSLIKKFVAYADTARLDSLTLFEKEVLETYTTCLRNYTKTLLKSAVFCFFEKQKKLESQRSAFIIKLLSGVGRV